MYRLEQIEPRKLSMGCGEKLNSRLWPKASSRQQDKPKQKVKRKKP